MAKSVAKDAPAKEPQVAAEDADMQKALEESLKSIYDVPRGPLPPVVIREPELRKYQPLPKVPGKGKGKNKGLEERFDKHGVRLYTLEQLVIPHQVSKAVNEVVTDTVDWAMQASLRNRFRDLPEADIKEILLQRMWETESYKSHKDHMQLYEALEKLMNHDHSKKLAQDLAEACKKKKKSRELPKTPPGSPPHQPPPPPPPAGPSGAPGASGSSQVPPPPPPPSSTNQENLEMDEDMAPDEQAQSSNDEDIGSAHIPKVNLRQD
nr:hypothetical protein [Tanacetum cinerariifolium]